MKNLTRIFVTVALLFAGFACTTDATEDLGVNLGGQTVVTLSLEESRTQLGAEVDGIYPLTWSEGDKIAINGVESSEAAILGDASKAAFSFNSTLNYPYEIAYPAAAAGKVVFASEQTHAGNTSFGGGVAAMYGYSEDGSNLLLKHLTGVLKVGVTGGATLTKAQISTVNGAIAGEFDINFTNGEVTPSAEATNVISYSFGEQGLKLSNDVQYLHIAVPAGEYNYLHLTLYDNAGGVMVAKVKADDTKPLNAGDVRHFKTPINYEPDSSKFVIGSYDDLVQFASAVAGSSDLEPFIQDVLMVANVTIPAEAEWTPIEGFASVFNGNGYEISGLKAPLFGTTSATIKDVKLANVDITITDTTYAGALACSLISTETATAVISNCEVSGTVKYSYNGYPYSTETENFDSTLVNVGGLVGRAWGASITNCVNRANIVVALATPTTVGTVKRYVSPTFGGIAGATHAAESGTATTLISHCKNYGTITVQDSKANVTYSSPCCGGMTGCMRDNSALVEYCDNYAPIEIKSACRQGDIGGIAGRMYGNIDNCTNHENAEITFFAEGRYSYIGGIAANVYGKSITNCTNKANLNYTYDTKSSSGYQYIGGIVAYTREVTTTISNCVNDGKISHTADVYGGTSNCFIRVGGVAGTVNKTTTFVNCENNGEVYVSGVKGNAKEDAASDDDLGVGGFIGWGAAADFNVSNCVNNGVVNFNVQLYAGSTTCHYYAGGFVGYANSAIDGATNNGAVNINTSVFAVEGKTLGGKLRVGGIVGYATKAVSNSTNTSKGIITFGEEAVAHAYNFGGIGGYIAGAVTSCTNEAKIDILGDANEDKHTVCSTGSNNIGGLGGHIAGAVSDSTNKGVVNFAKTATSYGYRIGGLAGYAESTFTSCDNEGPINVLGDALIAADSVRTMQIGGIVGMGKNKLTSCNNKKSAAITISGQILPGKEWQHDTWCSAIGGLGGYLAAVATTSYNEAPIHITYNVPATVSYTTKYAILAGGLVGYTGSGWSNCANKGDITLDGSYAGSYDLYFGGCICREGNTTYTNIDNEGDITVNVVSTSKGMCVGGVVSGISSIKGLKNCDNSGDLKLGESASMNTNFIAGGVGSKATAKAAQNFEACTNSGDILIDGSVTNQCIVGGIFGQFNYEGSVATGCSNSGSFHVTKGTSGKSSIKELYIGGFCGSQASKVATITNFTNSGDFNYDGKTTAILRIGGVVGSNTQATSNWSGLVNVGDITIAETSSYKATGTFLGGIIGNTAKGIVGATSFCNIKALNIASGASYGIIFGTARSSTNIAKDCKVGGSICVKQEQNEEYIVADVIKQISSDNFMDHIYSGTTDWSSVDNYDGCSAITEEPKL